MNVLNFLKTLIFFFMALRLWGKCYIQIPPKMLLLKETVKTEQVQDIIESSNCSDKELRVFLDIIQKIEGRISSTHFNRLIKEEGNSVKIQIRPSAIEVFHLKNIIKNKIELREGLKVEELKIINPVNLVAINDLSSIQVQCYSCNNPGIKNINIVYNDFLDNYRKNIWATIKISQLHKIVVAKSDIRAFSSFSIKDRMKIIHHNLNDSSLYLGSLSDLKYFTVNKHIKKGERIKHSHLTPKRLVKAGQAVDVIILKGGLRLEGRAVARQAGKYREFIEMYHLETNKKIRGQVVGFNKVQIEI